MKQYLKPDEWCIIEEGFNPEYNLISESVFSIGNGRMGQRANFEEQYSGHTLRGSYIAGVYYPDKTRVGWWKNGYPEYFAKVLNAANWIGIDIAINGEPLDLATCQVHSFQRVLNMREGYLERSFIAQLPEGEEVEVHAKRFCSIVDDEAGAIYYSIKALNFEGKLAIMPYIDGDIINKDANYDEKFWDGIHREAGEHEGYVTMKTKKTGFQVCTGMIYKIFHNGQETEKVSMPSERAKFVSNSVNIKVKQGDEVVIYKYAVNLTSENHPADQLLERSREALHRIAEKGFDQMLQEQAAAWIEKWKHMNITIEGDVTAQQGIRFNIFQLHQTYTGQDERLNIGPKGFTGEKYGGSTYWDTEAYCLPFYLATDDPKVARNLLIYRHKQLGKAIENAQKLGFTDGAALYPMVTMNGEECHNEWEITFEEIHRNGAIAYAIHDYIRYTGDEAYLPEYGLEVLLGIARFWAQRFNWSEQRQKYVMLGVTGPNEYENNVNNNWHTNTIAVWCLEYCLEAVEYARRQNPHRYQEILRLTHFDEHKEPTQWKHIIENTYFPTDEPLGIFLQQDGYMDKEQVLVKDLNPNDLPLNQKWSWDRILRSCFIKQADVLQSLYFFEERYDLETVRRNFDFYEPRTVHESSLSPCVHSILASKLGYQEKAYEMYLRTARLDLDDYNNDTEDGCHITSMAGTWMSVVKGFGGMRVQDGQLHFNPFIPTQWKSYSFRVGFRGCILKVIITKDTVNIENQSAQDIKLFVNNLPYQVAAHSLLKTQVQPLLAIN